MKELDVIKLKTGKTGTIIEVFENGKAFMIDVVDVNGKTIETPIVQKEEIEKVEYAS